MAAAESGFFDRPIHGDVAMTSNVSLEPGSGKTTSTRSFETSGAGPGSHVPATIRRAAMVA